MSQLPWGGRPTSPVDDPDNTTGPGQDAPAGPDPDAAKCDCTCPDYNELPWLPPGDGPPGGDPDYEGTYYVLIRCRDDAEQPAWVQSNEFTPGEVLLIETDGVKTCFYVDSVEVPNASVQDTNVIRPGDVVSEFDTCNACRTSDDPEIVDPDPPLPPILPTSYAQLAFCADDTLAPLWTPVEVFGIPVNEDLTKIYKIANVCYYISNNIQPTPGGPLMPVFGADAFDTCGECNPPCGNCNPSVGAAPNAASVTGITGGAGCTASNASHAYSGFSSNANLCAWSWSDGSGSNIQLVYAKTAVSVTTPSAGSCPIDLAAEEWSIAIEDFGLGAWHEKTTGFSCNESTGKIEGGHTYATTQCVGGGSCGGTPTVAIV